MIYELLALSEVLKAVESTGTEVRYHAPECREEVAGFYRLNATVDRLVICPRNQHNHSDLFDTIRHEAVHVVQACNGWDTLMPVSNYAEAVTDEIKDSLSDYPNDKQIQNIETEAYVLAKHLNEKEVVQLINKYCFK